MKIREEIFEHPNWWQTNSPIRDLNETSEEFRARVAYLRYIEPNPRAVEEGFFEETQFDYETLDEYRARIREYYMSIDLGADEKCQDGYYLDPENVKKDMLGGELEFDTDWYTNHVNSTQAN